LELNSWNEGLLVALAARREAPISRQRAHGRHETAARAAETL
jgi:hypothetical protein